MKLRINNNSIRLRLTQPEVAMIGNGMAVEESLFLHKPPNENFRYRLEPCDQSATIVATYAAHQLLVKVPKSEAASWATTEQVSLRHVQNEGTENASMILIEKDFQCLHKRPDEDETHNFPNPLMR